MYYVYMVACADGTLYTGCTNDLERRLAQHNSGVGAKYTRSRHPVRLVYREPVENRSQALRREAAIKRLSRAEKLALIGRGGGAEMPTLLPMTRRELEALYPVMAEDFPPSELKPLSRLLGLFDRGVYDGWRLWADGAPAGYAALLRTAATPYHLLDYLAMAPARRGKGCGSRCLELLKERYPEGFLIEAEAPEPGLPETVNALRRRRIAFYQRAGCVPCPFDNRIFGVRYLVHLWAPDLPERPGAAAADGLRELYRCQLPPALFDTQVEISTPIL